MGELLVQLAAFAVPFRSEAKYLLLGHAFDQWWNCGVSRQLEKCRPSFPLYPLVASTIHRTVGTEHVLQCKPSRIYVKDLSRIYQGFINDLSSTTSTLIVFGSPGDLRIFIVLLLYPSLFLIILEIVFSILDDFLLGLLLIVLLLFSSYFSYFYSFSSSFPSSFPFSLIIMLVFI